jgi:hypothetical protein
LTFVVTPPSTTISWLQSNSRMPFVWAYPRERQEMVFDAHAQAFDFFKGACTRGIYGNMKTPVEAVFIGKDRRTEGEGRKRRADGSPQREAQADRGDVGAPSARDQTAASKEDPEAGGGSRGWAIAAGRSPAAWPHRPAPG